MNPRVAEDATTLSEPLRVLIADGRLERLEEVARVISGLGHEAIPRAVDLDALGELTTAERPDVTIVIVGESSECSLELIGKMVRQAASPIIALLDVEDAEFIKEAAKRGVFAYLTGVKAAELQSAMDIVLRRFSEYQNLEGAFARRAVTERAKGILMERHNIEEADAFNMLRSKARRAELKLIDVAEAVVFSRSLLPGRPPQVAESLELVAESGRRADPSS